MLKSDNKIKVIESIAVPISLIIIGYLIDSLDPFFINNQFSWLILAPLIVSLRYGYSYGLISTALLISSITIVFYLGEQQVPVFPKETIVGLLLVTMISAEFHSKWFNKAETLMKKNTHTETRAKTLVYSYHILKGSHNQLEQHISNQVKSLRSTLFDLNSQIPILEQKLGGPLEGIGKDILNIFANYTNVQIAAIYAVNEHKKVSPEPVACLGCPPSLCPSNPLIRNALETGYVASINEKNSGSDINTSVLAVVPLIDVYQRIWGVVTVNEIPIFAFQENTLDLFAVLGGRIGGILRNRYQPIDYKISGSKAYAIKLQQALEEVKFLDEQFVNLSIVFSAKEFLEKKTLLSRIQTELRGVDNAFIYNDNKGEVVLLILLPYTNEYGAYKFLQRIGFSKLPNQMIKYGLDKDKPINTQSNIRVCMWILDKNSSYKNVTSEIKHFCKIRLMDGI